MWPKRDLHGKKVAILVADGFEQEEMTVPRQALEDAGARTDLISPAPREVRGWREKNWGECFRVDVPLDHADAERYDALVLPGGVMNPDQLRTLPAALRFIVSFFEAGKPVAAICHGPWSLIDAGVVRGRQMTSYASIQSDLKNAGAYWRDEPVVCDRGLVTSRQPADLEAFCGKMIEEFAEGYHVGQQQAVHG